MIFLYFFIGKSVTLRSSNEWLIFVWPWWKHNRILSVLIALISAMGGFSFGYDWVVIGGAKPFYEQYFQIAGNPVLQGWAMSSALIGCPIGALSAGKWVTASVGSRFLHWRQDSLFVPLSVREPPIPLLFQCFQTGRRVCHRYCFQPVADVYYAEIAPAHLRGRFVAINQLTVVLGILASDRELADRGTGSDRSYVWMIRESWNGQMDGAGCFGRWLCRLLCFHFSFILPESSLAGLFRP